MKLLANPIILRTLAVFVLSVFAFLIAVVFIRKIRRSVIAEDFHQSPRIREDNAGVASLSAYDGIVAGMKKEQDRLDALCKAEHSRAISAETLNEIMLANMTSGVILFNSSLTIRQANPAAKGIFEFASAGGLHARDIFSRIRSVKLESGSDVDNSAPLVEALGLAIKSQAPAAHLEAIYATRAGSARVLRFTIAFVHGTALHPSFAACLVSDITEAAAHVRQVARLREMSGGLAHEFKNSLSAISDCVNKLRATSDEPLRRQLSDQIAKDAALLSQAVDDFLHFSRPADVPLETLER